VSIKNKLVTAVTTAGLLAGLFGSAFVPVARAAADDATTVGATCTSADKTGSFASLAQKCWYVSTVKPTISIPVVYSGAGDDVGLYSVTVTGGTLFSFAVTRVATGAGTIVLNNGIDTVRDNVTTAANADGSTYAIVLNTIAAGSSATVKVTDDDSTIITLTITSVAAAAAAKATAYTSVDADQTTTRTLSDDVTAANTAAGQPKAATAVNGTSTVNDSVDYVSAGHTSANGDTGSYEVAYIIKNSYGDAIDISAKQFTASTTCGGVDIGAASADADDEPGVTSSVAVGSNVGALYVTVDHPGADEGCKATVTVTELATGLVIDTWSVGFIGETASLTLSGPSYLGSDLVNDTDLEDQITVVAKDKNGIVRPGLFSDPTFTVTDEAGVDIAETFVDTNANGGTANDNIFDLDNAVCASGKEGKTRTIYAEGETLVATGKTKSNTLTITCTGKLAYVSAIAFEKASYYPSEAATVTFTMKDSAGRVAGVGSYMANGGFAMSNSPATGGSATTEPATTIVSATLAGILVVEDGIYEFSYVMGSAAGVAGFLFDIADNDGATAGSQQGLFTVKTVVTAAFAAVSDGTLTTGKNKKVGTATFGAAAGKKVAFVLESASGVTKTYYRKANANGVAKYRLALRGTWTVYATFGDEITDTVTLRK